MTRPVIFGAGACGLLLAGLVVRPALWSGGGDSAETVSIARANVETRPNTVRATGLRPVTQLAELSQVELQREAEIIWQRAVEVQGQLHREPPAEHRERLLAQLEDLVDRSNAVQELLDAP